jgi:hypothetical protein
MKTLSMIMLIALGAFVSQAQAGHHCGCPSCGCARVKKICRLVEDVKKTTVFCYKVECEDFCIPGPSPCCGTKCVPNDCPCIGTGFHKEIIFGKPCGCGKIRTKKSLVKVPVDKEMRIWTCKVERVCCGCGCAQLDAKATAEARAQEIIPASAEEPIVLDENSSFDENVAIISPTADDQADESSAEATDATSANEPAVASKPKTFWDRLIGR